MVRRREEERVPRWRRDRGQGAEQSQALRPGDFVLGMMETTGRF